MIKKVLDGLVSTNWTDVYQVRLDGCYCLSLETDLESYLEIEGHTEGCIMDFVKDLESKDLIQGYSLHNLPYEKEKD